MQNYLFAVSAVIGIGALIVGIGAMFLPVLSSGGFGIKVSEAQSAYVRVTGARDVFIGLIFLYLFLERDYQTLSMVSFFTAFVSGSDFFITRKYGSKLKSLFHLGATIAAILYGVLIAKAGHLA